MEYPLENGEFGDELEFTKIVNINSCQLIHDAWFLRLNQYNLWDFFRLVTLLKYGKFEVRYMQRSIQA